VTAVSALAPALPLLHAALGVALAAWTLLFLFRIVLTWYPQIDLERGAMRLIGWPTEAVLRFSRRWIPAIGGVDVTPVIWVGLISLLRELVVGQQGLLTQVMRQSQSLG
jgi:YggT family protein